jgi:hypothetical protein
MKIFIYPFFFFSNTENSHIEYIPFFHNKITQYGNMHANDVLSNTSPRPSTIQMVSSLKQSVIIHCILNIIRGRRGRDVKSLISSVDILYNIIVAWEPKHSLF